MEKEKMEKNAPRIPVVDFSIGERMNRGTSCWVSAQEQVCRALEEIGCFMAILPNRAALELHGTTVFGTLTELLDLPIHDTPEKPFRGSVTSLPAHKALGIQNATNPEETREFTHQFWPNGNHQFRESADFYAKMMSELDQVVTRMVFEKYGVKKYHDDHVDSSFYYLRLIKYVKPDWNGMEVVGLTSHTDKTFTTIIHQNHVNGLEIRTKEDHWIVYDPPPSSVIFLAGDVFQVWSNDRIQACRHRVTLRENEIRYAVGAFSFKKGVIHVPDELVDEDHPLKYKPVNHVDIARSLPTGETVYAAKDYSGI